MVFKPLVGLLLLAVVVSASTLESSSNAGIDYSPINVKSNRLVTGSTFISFDAYGYCTSFVISSGKQSWSMGAYAYATKAPSTIVSYSYFVSLKTGTVYSFTVTCLNNGQEAGKSAAIEVDAIAPSAIIAADNYAAVWVNSQQLSWGDLNNPQKVVTSTPQYGLAYVAIDPPTFTGSMQVAAQVNNSAGGSYLSGCFYVGNKPVVTDSRWKCKYFVDPASATSWISLHATWTAPGFDDDDWTACKEIGKARLPCSGATKIWPKMETSSPAINSVALYRINLAASAPADPTNLVVQAGLNSLTATFEPSLNGLSGLAVTYTVTCTSNGASVSASGSVSPIIISGLSRQSYSCSLIAKNSVGSSKSVSHKAVSPVGAPSAPTNVAVLENIKEGSAKFSFTAADLAGSTLKAYHLTATPSTGDVVVVTGTASPIVVTDKLAKGTPYSVVIKTQTELGGESAPSYALTFVSYTSPPEAAKGTCAAPVNAAGSITTPNDGSIMIKINPPTGVSASCLGTYTVSVTPASATAITPAPQTVEQATNKGVKFSDVTPGVAYAITVVTTNSKKSTSTSAFGTVTPATVPGTVSSITVVPAATQLSVTGFTAPTQNGGSAITSYEVAAYTSNDAVAQTITVTAIPTTASPAVINNLVNNVKYYIGIKAINAQGKSAVSKSEPISVGPACTPPTLTGTPYDSKVVVSWTAPTNCYVSSYTLSCPSCPTTSASIKAGTSSYSMIGLTNAQSYSFSLTVTSTSGLVSTPSSVSATPKTNFALNAPTWTSGGSGVVSISYSVRNGINAGITSYKLVAKLSGSADITCGTGGAETSGLSCTGLTDNKAYTIVVSASNGAYTRTTSVSGVYPGCYSTSGVPPAPTVTAATGLDTYTLVNVSLATTCSSMSYVITVKTSTATFTTKTVAAASATNYQISKLTNGVTYTITATAKFGKAVSASSAAVTVVPAAATVGAVKNIQITAGDKKVDATWAALATATSWKVDLLAAPGSNTATALQTITVTTTSATFSSLTNGVSYALRITVGTAVTISRSFTPGTVATSPTITSVTPLDASVLIGFSVPSSNGGLAISSYTVTATPVVSTTASGVVTNSTSSSPVTLSGLTNGAAYTITVVAVNEFGASAAASSTNSVTPNTVPSTPANVVATAANGQASVSFNASTSATTYVVYATLGGAATSISANTTTSPVTITGLTNGVQYQFYVVAFNTAFNSEKSDPSSAVTCGTVPGAPTAVAAVAGDRFATVSWTAPASNGFISIVTYTITSNPDGKTKIVGGNELSTDISELTNGVSYTFTVVATNAFGDSAASTASAAVIPVTAPSAPTDAKATYGNGQITCSFNAPASNGGLAIVSYTITLSTGRVITNVPGSPYTVTSLTNGQAVSFNVTAYNGVFNSASSVSSVEVTPSTVPDAPTTVTAIAKQDKATTVSWSAPANTGGAAILYYIVSSNDGQKVTTADAATSTSFTGLTNGNSYDFTVQAVNTNGRSVQSAASAAIIPASAPNAPAGLVVTSYLNGKVIVTWDAPFNQGDAITTYTLATSDEASSVQVTETANADGSKSRTGTVSGLTNGQTYKFKVRATNSLGASAWSDLSGNALPAGPSDAPTNIVATSGYDAQSSVSFTAPTFNGGVAISSYTVFVTPDNLKFTGTASPIVCTGLQNGQNYSFLVTATNEKNYESTSSTAATAIPVGAPNAPVINSVVSSLDKQVQLTFTPPTWNGGAALVSYTVSAVGDSTKTVSGTFAAAAAATTVTITGLTNGQSYTFVAQVKNSGTSSNTSPLSEASEAAIPAGPSQSPTDLNAAASENGQSTVSFTVPGDNGGSAIVSYTVTSSPDGKTATGTASPIVVTGLTNGKSYTFTATAKNSVGHVSSASVASSPIVPAGPSTAVTGVAAAVTPNSGEVKVTFTAPSDNGGSPINLYTVTADGVSVVGSASPITVSGLTNGKSYTFSVVATNVAGYKSPVAASNAVIPVGPSDPVTAVTGTPNQDTKSTVSFTAPAFNGGAAITSYTVVAAPGGQQATGTQSPIVVSGLTNGVEYTFTITATNAGGHASRAASSTVAIIPVGKPTVVTSVVGTSFQNGQSSVSFTAPTFNGGAAVIIYTVTAKAVGTAVSGAVATSSATGVASPIIVNGLTNGQSYTFTVVAKNTPDYASDVSADSAAVTPATVPDVVTGIAATSLEDASSIITFTPPVNTGGDAITGYKLAVSNQVIETTSTTVQFTGLTNGLDHKVVIRACNRAGCGSEAGSNTFKPATIPDAPTNVQATNYDNTQSTVSFSAPLNNGGDAVVLYTVAATGADGHKVSVDGTVSPIVVTGLHNAIYYTFVVSAKNNAKKNSGLSAPSAASSPALPYNQPPEVQTISSLTTGPDACLVRWTPAALHPAVTSSVFKLTVSDGTTTQTYDVPQKFADASAVSGPVQSLYLATGLAEDKTYTFSIVSVVTMGTKTFIPSASKSATCTSGANVAPVAVYWTRESDNEAPTLDEVVLSYEWPGSRKDVDCHLHNNTVSNTPLQKAPSPNFVLKRQPTDLWFNFIVTCQNNKGLSPASAPLLVKSGMPGAPSFTLAGKRTTTPYTYTEYAAVVNPSTSYTSYELQYKGQTILTDTAGKFVFTVAGSEMFRCFTAVGITASGDRVPSNAPVCFTEITDLYNVQFETSSNALRRIFKEAAHKRKATKSRKQLLP